MQRLLEQVAIVTGGAQGIGGSTARRLAEEGAKVLIADIDLKKAKVNVEGIRAQGNKAEALQVDVSKQAEIEAMVASAVARWGRLDILVNNAYNVLTASRGGAVEVTEEDWDQDMAVLMKSVFLGAKHAVPEMRKVLSRSETARRASSRRSTRSVRQSLASSTAARGRLP